MLAYVRVRVLRSTNYASIINSSIQNKNVKKPWMYQVNTNADDTSGIDGKHR